MVQITIEVGGETLERKIDPDSISLGFLDAMEQAQERKTWAALIPAYAELLRITPEQARSLTLGDVKRITAALGEAATVPNGSAPPSA